MHMMTFTKYDTNKFMATNALTELDIEVVTTDDRVYFKLSSAFDKYQFESFDKAVKFAEHKYGVDMKLSSEDDHYNELYMQDSDGSAILGGQV